MNFLPFSAQSKTLPVSATDVASAGVVLPCAGNSVRLVNEGPDDVFICIAATATAATLPNATPTATSTPVLAGSDISLSIPNAAAMYISAICRSGKTALLDVQVGEGI